jgi:hypothetical protein
LLETRGHGSGTQGLVDDITYKGTTAGHFYVLLYILTSSYFGVSIPMVMFFCCIFDSQLWNCFHEPERVREGFERSLKLLKLDYIDVFLIHWPIAFQVGHCM